MTIEERKKLVKDYMAKCPFIEFHQINELDEEGVNISIAFDLEYKGEIKWNTNNKTVEYVCIM